MLTLPNILAGIILVALTAYVLFAGADFGGGVWDLLASGVRKRAERELVPRCRHADAGPRRPVSHDHDPLLRARRHRWRRAVPADHSQPAHLNAHAPEYPRGHHPRRADGVRAVRGRGLRRR